MTKAKVGIHFIKAALDEIGGSKGNQIVLRGVIDPASLNDLKIDEYQREALPLSALNRLWQALRDGESLPDIELAMRGNDFDVAGKNDSEFWLKGDVYIIDGQQRRNAALHILTIQPDLDIRLGAMVHFGTTREWERDRFKILNLDRSRVSADVLLRNMRHQSAAVLTLYGLSHNQPDFALFERVCWKQSKSVKELITARTLVTVAATLHAHRSRALRYGLDEIVPALDRQAKFIKLDRWRKNIVHFFDFVDEAYGLRNITFRDLSLQIRAGFLSQLALLISDHSNFWRDPSESDLYIDPDWRKRFSSFPMHDPIVVSTISGGGQQTGSASLIYSLLRDHLNKGRSTNRLRNRKDEIEASKPRAFSSYAAGSDEDELEYPHDSEDVQ
jgi:hypothetical protein